MKVAASLIETVEGVEKSFVATHYWKHHGGENTARQSAEAVLIRNSDENKIMISKSKFVQPIDIKEKYELPSGNWAEAQREKLTKKSKEEFRKILKKKYSKEEVKTEPEVVNEPTEKKTEIKVEPENEFENNTNENEHQVWMNDHLNDARARRMKRIKIDTESLYSEPTNSNENINSPKTCLLYTSPSPRDS